MRAGWGADGDGMSAALRRSTMSRRLASSRMKMSKATTIGAVTACTRATGSSSKDNRNGNGCRSRHHRTDLFCGCPVALQQLGQLGQRFVST